MTVPKAFANQPPVWIVENEGIILKKLDLDQYCGDGKIFSQVGGYFSQHVCSHSLICSEFGQIRPIFKLDVPLIPFMFIRIQQSGLRHASRKSQVASRQSPVASRQSPVAKVYGTLLAVP